jgi:hypothetical protein
MLIRKMSGAISVTVAMLPSSENIKPTVVGLRILSQLYEAISRDRWKQFYIQPQPS